MPELSGRIQTYRKDFLGRAGNVYKKMKSILYILNLKTRTEFGIENAYLLLLGNSGLDM